MRRRPQFPTLFTDVFPIDVKVDVTLIIVPIETLASSAVFVTKALCPNNKPFFKVTQIFSSFHLDTKSESTAQHFYACHRA